MADLSQTAASVAPGTGAQTTNITFGESVVAGQPVYLNTSDNKYYLSDNNASGKKSCNGISLNGGAAGQPGTIQTTGQINLGATLAVGVIYCVSANAGAICPAADVTSTHDMIILGVAISASLLQMPTGPGPFTPGITVA